VTSEPRLGLFRGLLRYRKALGDIGVCEGFQWVNGSFVEQTETTRGRPPRDIDVVTFARLPQGVGGQRELSGRRPDLFIRKCTKESFGIDGFWGFLGEPMTEATVRRVAYWCGQWSHQRGSFAWKGFVQLGLSPASGHSVEAVLSMKEEEFRHDRPQ
jgi:hypothetical protein